jgi:membrane protein DedA with SNARE-associated domain
MQATDSVMPDAPEMLIYVAAFISPFVQEDAAIIGAMSIFIHPETNTMASGPVVLASMICGLIMSDLWKYWIGYAGRSHTWAQKIAGKRAVGLMGAKIVAHPGTTLLLARFIPGTRIPAYIAAGFFKLAFARFAFWIMVSALAYVGVAWAVLVSVGAIAGKTGQLYVAGALIVALLVYAGLNVIRARRDDKVS